MLLFYLFIFAKNIITYFIKISFFLIFVQLDGDRSSFLVGVDVNYSQEAAF